MRVEKGGGWNQIRPQQKKLGPLLFYSLYSMLDNLTFYGCTLGLEGTTVSTTSLQGGHLRYRVLHTKQPILTPRFTQDGGGFYGFDQCCGSMTFWGWIRIRGSMPLTNGSGSGSWIRILLLSSLTFKMPTKNYFFNTIFLLITF
jgi:hypothetical protein